MLTFTRPYINVLKKNLRNFKPSTSNKNLLEAKVGDIIFKIDRMGDVHLYDKDYYDLMDELPSSLAISIYDLVVTWNQAR